MLLYFFLRVMVKISGFYNIIKYERVIKIYLVKLVIFILCEGKNVRREVLRIIII